MPDSARLQLSSEPNRATLWDSALRAIAPDNRGRTAAVENLELYREYRDGYRSHLEAMEVDWEFGRLGIQWTQNEIDELEDAGQPDIVFNQCRRITEQYVAMLAGRAPRWAVAPRLAGAVPVARVLADLLSYCWDISRGRTQVAQTIINSVVMGTGAMGAFLDPNEDYGRGDVIVRDINPRTLFIDPSIRDPFARDAEHLILSQLVPRTRVAQEHPEYREMIEKAASDTSDEDWVNSTGSARDRRYTWAEGDNTHVRRDPLRVIDRYTKILQPHWLVLEPSTGEPFDLIPKENWRRVRKLVEQADAALRSRFPDSAGVEVTVREVNVWRVRQVRSLTTGPRYAYSGTPQAADTLLDRVLPITRYPVVPLFHIFTGSPFALSEIRDVRSVQEFINKMFSLLVKSATGIASGGQWLVPKESGAMEEIEKKGAKPNAVIGYAGGPAGKPEKTIPGVLPQGHFALIEKAESVMDAITGMSAQLQGVALGDRESAQLRAIRNEEATRRPDQKLAALEEMLSELGQVQIEMAQAFYRDRKVFSLSDTAGKLQATAIDPESGQIVRLDGETIYGSINVGQYAVRVIPGSTKPTNRMEKLAEAIQIGTILSGASAGVANMMAEYLDDPVLRDGALAIAQERSLQPQMAQMQEEIQRLGRRLQISENESLNARKAVDVAQADAALAKKLVAFEAELGTIKREMKSTADRLTADLSAETRVVKATVRSSAQNRQVQRPAKSRGAEE